MPKTDMSFSDIEKQLGLKELDIQSIMVADALLHKKQRVELVPTKTGVKTAKVYWDTVYETHR